MPPKKGRKRFVIDAGTGDRKFVQALQKRNPNDRVIGIDHDPENRARIKQSMGEFFKFTLKEPERVKSVWLNHVSFYSPQGLKEMQEVVDRIPKGTPVVITIRKRFLQELKTGLSHVGLKIHTEIPWSPKMQGSELTKNFYEKSKRNEENTPIRVIAIKPK